MFHTIIHELRVLLGCVVITPGSNFAPYLASVVQTCKNTQFSLWKRYTDCHSTSIDALLRFIEPNHSHELPTLYSLIWFKMCAFSANMLRQNNYFRLSCLMAIKLLKSTNSCSGWLTVRGLWFAIPQILFIVTFLKVRTQIRANIPSLVLGILKKWWQVEIL